MVETVTGDLLNYPADYIVQQCNCQTYNAKGLAEAVFRKWPHTNTYGKRPNTRKVGDYDIFRVNQQGCKDRFVVNLYGQNLPSRASSYETESQRLYWFKTACDKLATQVQPQTIVAFPYYIGCGLAGGHWTNYLAAINEFAVTVAGKQVKVIIVRLPESG